MHRMARDDMSHNLGRLENRDSLYAVWTTGSGILGIPGILGMNEKQINHIQTKSDEYVQNFLSMKMLKAEREVYK